MLTFIPYSEIGTREITVIVSDGKKTIGMITETFEPGAALGYWLYVPTDKRIITTRFYGSLEDFQDHLQAVTNYAARLKCHYETKDPDRYDQFKRED